MRNFTSFPCSTQLKIVEDSGFLHLFRHHLVPLQCLLSRGPKRSIIDFPCCFDRCSGHRRRANRLCFNRTSAQSAPFFATKQYFLLLQQLYFLLGMDVFKHLENNISQKNLIFKRTSHADKPKNVQSTPKKIPAQGNFCSL